MNSGDQMLKGDNVQSFEQKLYHNGPILVMINNGMRQEVRDERRSSWNVESSKCLFLSLSKYVSDIKQCRCTYCICPKRESRQVIVD
jgi:hypothetical protein